MTVFVVLTHDNRFVGVYGSRSEASAEAAKGGYVVSEEWIG